MTENRPYVSWDLMNDFMTDAFAAYGVPREDAAICADVLLTCLPVLILYLTCQKYIVGGQTEGAVKG